MSAIALGPFEGISVLGSGLSLPERVLTTRQALASVPAGASMSSERLDYAAEQLDDMLGLQNRHWSYIPGQTSTKLSNTATLAERACHTALQAAGLDASHLRALFTATSTPHRYTGTVSSAVGGALGVHAPCVDVRAGCSSGIFGTIQAAFYLSNGASHAAVIGADTFSAVIPPQHRLAAAAMGDGAAAMVLGHGPGSLRAIYFETDGSKAGLVSTPGAMPPDHGVIDAGGYRLDADLNGLDAQIPERYADAIDRVLAHAGVTPDDIDWFIPHQTSAATLADVARHVGLTTDKLWTHGIARHANIGAAGWIAGLHGAIERQDIKPGQLVLSASVGGGMSWGAALWAF